MTGRTAQILGLVLLGAATRMPPAHAAPAREWDAGFFYSRLEDADGNLRTRLLGPFFEWTTSPQGAKFKAARPLVSFFSAPDDQRGGLEVIWPIATSYRFQKERRSRLLLTYYTDFDVTNPAARYRFQVLPLYFQGRDIHGRFYAAVFPLGGRIHEFIGRDEIVFALFPLYAYSRVNEVETRDVLWPIYSRSEGKGISRFRVFPFYGYARHRAKFEKGFVAWPFYTWARYSYPDAQGRGYIVFPLWGHLMMPDQEAWLLIPPFFRFSRGERINYSYCPWPFFQISSGEIERFYLWPLWGQRTMRGLTSTYFLWPIFRSENADRSHSLYRSIYALPFYISQVETPRAPNARPTKVYRKVWPFFSYRREGEVHAFRMLDLWPAKNAPPVERNWAPLWTLFSRAGTGDRTDTELGWGLARQRRRGLERCQVSVFPLWQWERDDRRGPSRSWSVLHGLLGRRRDAAGVSWTLLYAVHWKTRETPP